MFANKLSLANASPACTCWLAALVLLAASIAWSTPAWADSAVILQADDQFTLAELVKADFGYGSPKDRNRVAAGNTILKLTFASL